MKKYTYSVAAAESRRLLRERTGRAHALLVGRGAAAIWATLTALDLHDRPVLIPANTCYIVLWAILQSGNLPFLVDIDPLTGNISAQTLDQVAVTQPAVLIPAHMYGIAAPMTALCEWARQRDVFVIEDAALALGSQVEGRSAGAWGDLSVFSFGQGKIADAGTGGALLTDDGALAVEIERVLLQAPPWTAAFERLNHQWLEIYWALHQFEAENPRLPELYPALFSIYGAITRCGMPKHFGRDLRPVLAALDANLAHRAELAAFYDERLAALPVRLLQRPLGASLWHYPVLVGDGQRNALLEHLWGAQLYDATRWYPSLQPMHRALAPDLPITLTPAADQFADEIINLPLSPDTDRDQAVMIIQTVSDYFAALEA